MRPRAPRAGGGQRVSGPAETRKRRSQRPRSERGNRGKAGPATETGIVSPLRKANPKWRRERQQQRRRRRRWRKWSREEGVVVSVWRRRRESFLQLHFRSAFCSTHPTPPSRREGRPRRQEDWFLGPRRCPPGSSGPRSGVCECFYVGEGGGGRRRSSDLSSRLVSPRLYMFPALRRRKRSRSHPPSRPGL